ncbi:hypothetical protein [Streptomyces sp. NPDC054794]
MRDRWMFAVGQLCVHDQVALAEIVRHHIDMSGRYSFQLLALAGGLGP